MVKAGLNNWIVTESGNRISRQNVSITGTQHIVLGGKVTVQQGCTLRGDVAPLMPSAGQTSSPFAISIGRYTVLFPSCTVQPPSKVVKG